MASGKEGTTLGPYRVVEQVGMGGMATVYKAYQASMDRYVALKILPAHYAQDPKFVERFIREARTIAKLEHKNILPVYDFGEQDGITYLAMRFLDGGTLKDMLALGRLTLADAVGVVLQMCSALDYAHRQGVVHRDVKPANIMIDREGAAYLTDFGIAKVLESTLGGLTETGAAVGTPAYMAPEQSLGKPVDAKTDIYALGVVLYELVVGRPPYQADTPMAVALAHIHEPLPLPHELNPDVPDEIETVILKALAKEPNHRYESAHDMGLALEQALTSSGVKRGETTLLSLATRARDQAATQRIAVAADLLAAPQPTAPGAPDVAAPARRSLSPLAVAGLAGGALIAVLIIVFAAMFIPRWIGQTAAVKQTQPAPTAQISGTGQAAHGTAIVTAETTPTQRLGGGPVETAYDDFENPAYDGSANPDLWSVNIGPDSTCTVSQQQGVMVFTNRAKANVISACGLRVARPMQVPGAELESLEGRLQIKSDHVGGYVAQVIRATTDDQRPFWEANCGVGVGPLERSIGISFNVLDQEANVPNNVVYTRGVQGRFDQWYAIRLNVDPATMTVSCLVDGDRIGVFTPAKAADLRQRPFRRELGSWRMQNSAVTIYLDYFSLILP